MREHGHRLKAAVLLSLLPLLAQGQGVSDFELFHGTTTGSLAVKASSSPQSAASDDSDTALFTTAPNTYYRGPVVLSVTKDVEAIDDCLSLCSADSRCEFWSHCPSNATNGCEVMKFCNADQDATTDIQDAGTCILSRSKDGQKVILFEEGDGVTWTGGRYVANDDGKLPSPSGSPPLTPPGKSPSPSSNSTEACPVHEVPTDLALSASQTSVNWFVGLSGARAPPCYDVEKDDFIESPASYAPCRLAGEATKNVQALAQKLCDGTIGVGDDADVAVAQSIFFSAIQAGGQEAIDAVDALLYAQLVLNCWQGDTVSIVISPPHDEITGTTPHDTISNLVGFFVDVANAAEYAGMGICTTLVTTHDDDISTRKLLTRVHTGPDT